MKVKALKAPVLTCRFLEEEEGGRTRMISFFAKRARGLMARYVIDGRLENPEDLKGFDREGYAFRPDLSKAADWVFARPAK